LGAESRKHTGEKRKRGNRRFRSKGFLKEGKKKEMDKMDKCKCKCKRENAPFMPPTPLIQDVMML